MTDYSFRIKINRESLDALFTRFIQAMGYINPQQTLEIETLRYDEEEGTADIEGVLKTQELN